MTDTVTESTNAEPTDSECYVLGGDRLGASIARRLRAEGIPTTFVDETYEPSEGPSLGGDPRDVAVLEAAGVSDGSTVLVMTDGDGRNLLLAQLVRVHFGSPNLLVRVNDPDRRGLVADLGYVPICAATAISGVVADELTDDRPDSVPDR